MSILVEQFITNATNEPINNLVDISLQPRHNGRLFPARLTPADVQHLQLLQCIRRTSHDNNINYVYLRTSSQQLEPTTKAAGLKNIQDDLSSLDPGIHEARDLMQNRPLWRLAQCTHSGTCYYWIGNLS